MPRQPFVVVAAAVSCRILYVYHGRRWRLPLQTGSQAAAESSHGVGTSTHEGSVHSAADETIDSAGGADVAVARVRKLVGAHVREGAYIER